MTSTTTDQVTADQVVFRGIHKWYGEAAAVRDLHLGIRAGEFLTLLGPSGSGKTTTLRILAGLESASSGEVYLAGREVTHQVPEKRDIGMVFQNYALFPHLTVARNIAFPLQMRRQPRAVIAERVARVLEMTQLSEFRDRYPRQLSGGQQQRVALARAFVFDPSVLLMDEPLGALDRNLRDHMRLELTSLQRRLGATVMYVTHDQDEALAMSDRIGVMHRGVLQQTAPPDEIYERPGNSFVAKFLGQSVCLPATRLERGGQTVLEVTGLSEPVRVAADNDCCDTPDGAFMVRPERFRLDEHRPDTTDRNVAQASVDTTVYLGPQVQVHLRADAGAQVTLVLPATVAAGLRPGDTRWLSWSAEDGRFLPQVD